MLALNTETGEYEVTEDTEIIEIVETAITETDKAIELAKGLKTATTLAQVRSAATSVLGGGES